MFEEEYIPPCVLFSFLFIPYVDDDVDDDNMNKQLNKQKQQHKKVNSIKVKEFFFQMEHKRKRSEVKSDPRI